MARKPNYDFERRGRDRLKAEKKATRDKKKSEQPEKTDTENTPSTITE